MQERSLLALDLFVCALLVYVCNCWCVVHIYSSFNFCVWFCCVETCPTIMLVYILADVVAINQEQYMVCVLLIAYLVESCVSLLITNKMTCGKCFKIDRSKRKQYYGQNRGLGAVGCNDIS